MIVFFTVFHMPTRNFFFWQMLYSIRVLAPTSIYRWKRASKEKSNNEDSHENNQNNLFNHGLSFLHLIDSLNPTHRRSHLRHWRPRLPGWTGAKVSNSGCTNGVKCGACQGGLCYLPLICQCTRGVARSPPRPSWWRWLASPSLCSSLIQSNVFLDYFLAAWSLLWFTIFYSWLCGLRVFFPFIFIWALRSFVGECFDHQTRNLNSQIGIFFSVVNEWFCARIWIIEHLVDLSACNHD